MENCITWRTNIRLRYIYCINFFVIPGWQVGGWVTEYGNLLTFATVRGAAHMVPYAQPSRALHLFSSFVRGRRLPNNTRPSIYDWWAKDHRLLFKCLFLNLIHSFLNFILPKAISPFLSSDNTMKNQREIIETLYSSCGRNGNRFRNPLCFDWSLKSRV